MFQGRIDAGYGGGKKKICPFCGDEFVANTSRQRACIKISCVEKMRGWKSGLEKPVVKQKEPTPMCTVCGKEPVWVNLHGRAGKFCLDCKAKRIEGYKHPKSKLKAAQFTVAI